MTLWNPMNCSPPGSSVHGILQTRILEWVAIPFSTLLQTNKYTEEHRMCSKTHSGCPKPLIVLNSTYTVFFPINTFLWSSLGFPGGSDGRNLPTMRETQVQPLGQEDPLEKGMASTPVFLPGESHGQKSLVGYSPWGCKQLDTTERLSPAHVLDYYV